MVDTVRTRSALQTLLADNTSGAITPQNLRDFMASTPILSSGAGAPGSAPASQFEMYWDTTNLVWYLAEGVSTSADWKRITPGWDIAGSWTFSTNVTEVAFTGLAGYNELWIHARNITLATAGIRQLLVSTDNGSTYRNTSGDYKQVTTAGAEGTVAAVPGHITAVQAAKTCSWWIPQAGLAGVPKFIMPPMGAGTQYLFDQSTNPINAVKVNGSAGGNITTAGTILVLGR